MSEQGYFHQAFCHRLAGAAATLSVSLLLIFSGGTRAAEVREFIMGNTVTALSAAPPEVQVLYSAMRFNETTEEWNVDVIVTNGSPQTFTGQIVFSVEGFTGTTGPLRPDGFSLTAPGNPFYRLALVNPEQHPFAPGGVTPRRTIGLGYIEGAPAPHLTSKVFVRPLATSYALALTRTLDELGQPLTGVRVTEGGPLGARTLFTDSEYGVVTLGQEAAAHLWRFEHPGYLPAWRHSTLAANTVRLVPSPRLKRQASNVQLFSSAGGMARDSASNIVITAAAGAFSGETEARLTPIDGQTLPGLLPQGWSPLSAFWLQLSREPVQPLNGRLQPAAPIVSGDTAALVQWNTTQAVWIVDSLVTGVGSNAVTVSLASSGAYALVVPDGGSPAFVPPIPVDGQTLKGSASAPARASLSASGGVTPATRSASLSSDEATARATVQFSSSQGALPSGLVLRCDVREEYRLQDGSRRFTSPYENSLLTYQQPGDANVRTVHAAFPMRPILLFGPEELTEARVALDVLPSGEFSGGVFETNGTTLDFEGIQLIAAAGTFDRPQAALVRRLAETNFAGLLTSGNRIETVFDLTMETTAPGRRVSVQFSNAPNRQFVLARVLSDRRVAGLEPVERMASGTNGRVTTVEPPAGERLPGVTKSGQYVLVGVNGPQGLVSGTVRDGAGQFAAGAPVRIGGQPWMTLGASNGAYQLIAPTGGVQVATIDPISNDADFVDTVLGTVTTPLHVDLARAARGPRVLQVSPTDSATRVSRVVPVVVTFSEPINPGTVAANGVQLFTTNGQTVAASISLNLRGTVVTLLPANPMAPSTVHTVAVSSNITDLSGRSLEGPTRFTFTTESAELNRGNVELIIFAPGATNIPAEIRANLVGFDPGRDKRAVVVKGTPGAAEPGQPVILMNESSGETSTVLSKSDGSFYGVITGDEEDFISAMLINANGSRNFLPVSRQQFDNGFVGLYKRGGILEATNDAPSQVLVEPGAIEGRTKFRVEMVNVQQLLSLLGNTHPEGGRLLGAMQYEEKGDGLKAAADVKFPVDANALGLPPGTNPGEAAFALTIPRKFGDTVLYQIVDTMHFEATGDGRGQLVTRSPPFVGLLLRKLKALEANTQRTDGLSSIRFGQAGEEPSISPTPRTIFGFISLARREATVVNGHVRSAKVDESGSPNGEVNPVAGAIVSIDFAGAPSPPGSFRAGELVCLSDTAGVFTFAFDPGIVFQGRTLRAVHPRFPRQVAGPVGISPEAAGAQEFAVDLLFALPDVTDVTVSGVAPPIVQATENPLFPAVGTGQTDGTVLTVSAADDAGVGSIIVDVEKVEELLGPRVLSSDLVNVQASAPRRTSETRLGQDFRVRAQQSVRATLKVTVNDTDGHTVEILHVVPFGGTAPVVTPGSDERGPRVVRSWPPDMAKRIPSLSPIQILFNEPLDPTMIEQVPPNWLTMDVDHRITSLQASENFRLVTVSYEGKPDGIVKLTVGSGLTDRNGNAFDQNPTTDGNDDFNLEFEQAEPFELNLPGIEDGAGVVFQGGFAYALERKPDGGKLVALEFTDTAELDTVTEIDINGRPSDLSLVSDYSLLTSDTSGNCSRGDYVAVFSGAATDVKRLTVVPVLRSGNSIKFGGPIRGAISTSPASMAVKSKWDPPFLGYLESGADVTSIGLLDLNVFAMGNLASPAEIDAFPDQQQDGQDNNLDGDYCDDGDVPPRPGRSRAGPFGLSFSFAPEDPSERIVDFDFDADFGLLATIFSRPGGTASGLRVVLAGLGVAPLPNAIVSFLPSDQPKRVLLLPGVRVLENDVEVVRDLALVSTAGSGNASGSVLVVDITHPEAPVLLPGRILLPQGEGSANTIQLRPDGMLVLATSINSLLLDPRKLLLPQGNQLIHPAVVGLIEGAGSGVRTYVSDISGINIVNAGPQQRLIQSAPHCEIITFSGEQSLLPAEILATKPPDEIRRYLAGAKPISIAQVASLDATNLPPVEPGLHYYVLIHAPGGAGEVMDVAMASVDARGGRLPTARNNEVPTILEDPSIVTFYKVMAVIQWAKLVVRDAKIAANAVSGNFAALPATIVQNKDSLLRQIQSTIRWISRWESYPTVLMGHRLASNEQKASELYNTYLAGPVVLLSHPLKQNRLNELQNQLRRNYLRAGSGLWAGPGIGRASDFSPLSRMFLPVFALPGTPEELQPTQTPLPPTYLGTDQRQNPVIGRYTAEMTSARGLLADNVTMSKAIADAIKVGNKLRSINSSEGALPAILTVLETAVGYLNSDFDPVLTPGAFVFKPVAFEQRPIVFVPGIMGSELHGSGGKGFWILGAFKNESPTFDQRPLDLDQDGNSIDDTIRPSDVTRSVLVVEEIYAPLLEFLSTDLGYVEYDFKTGVIDGQDAAEHPELWHRRRLLKGSGASPNLAQSPLPTLYVFAYDWRQDNAISAAKLKEYIDVVREMHPEAEKVDIIAHSMGGLVSRRYILENPERVHRFITLGTPWLGAGKAINAMRTGDFDEAAMNAIAPKPMLKRAGAFMPGVHQLVPAKGLFDLGLNPLFEAGWDLNTNGVAYETYSYTQYRETMESHLFRKDLKDLFGGSAPAKSPVMDNNEALHFFDGGALADWRNDNLAIEYFHLLGIQSVPQTIGRVALTSRLVPADASTNDVVLNAPLLGYRESDDSSGDDRPPRASVVGQLPLGTNQYKLTGVAELVRVMGDGTVPVLSLSRGRGSSLDRNSPDARVYPVVTTFTKQDKLANHNGMIGNPRTLEVLQNILEERAPDEVIVTINGGASAREGSEVILTAGATRPPGAEGNPTFVWDFGDGGGEISAGARHTFFQDGTNVITCAVTYENGFAGVGSKVVVVENAPPAVEIENGDIEIPVGAAPILIVKVTDPGINDQHSFHWDFNNDGVIDFEGSFVAVPEFNTPGTFTVKVTVEDDAGANASDSITVRVGQGQSPVLPAFNPIIGTFPGGFQQHVQVRIAGRSFESSDGLIVRDEAEVLIAQLLLEIDNILGTLFRIIGNVRTDDAGAEMMNLNIFRKMSDAGPASTTARVQMEGADRLVEIEALYLEGGVPQKRFTWEAFLPRPDDPAGTLIFDFEQKSGRLEVPSAGGLVEPKSVQTGKSSADHNGPAVALVRNARTGRVFIVGRDDFSEESRLEYFLAEDRNDDGQFVDEIFYKLNDRSFKEEAWPSRAVAIVARDEAGNLSRIEAARIRTTSDVDFKHFPQGVTPPPVYEDDYCFVLNDIRAAARNAINDGLNHPQVRRFLVTEDDIWFFEQGSGACLWKNNSCDTCKPAFKPQKSDNDYELFMPVHKGRTLTRQEFIDSDPYSSDNTEGDWYFKPPQGLGAGGLPIDSVLDNGQVNPLVTAWSYRFPPGVMNSAAEAEFVVQRPFGPGNLQNPFFERLTPAEVISFFFTFVTKTNAAYRKFLPEASFFPFRREHFQYAFMSLEKPVPFGDDKVGDAGMGRHLLLLKWLLEGAYIQFGSGPLNDNTIALNDVFQNLVARGGVPAAEGFEWGVFQDFAALRAGARVRLERTDLPANLPRSIVRDDFAERDRQIASKVGKAAIRATLARIAGHPAFASLVMSVTPAQYATRNYPTFENFIADLATNQASGLFSGQAALISQFIAAKTGDKGFLDKLIDDQKVPQFIADALVFMRTTVQAGALNSHNQYLQSLLNARGDAERFARVRNFLDVENGYQAGSDFVPGRQELMGQNGGMFVAYPLNFRVQNLGLNVANDVSIVAETGGPGPAPAPSPAPAGGSGGEFSPAGGGGPRADSWDVMTQVNFSTVGFNTASDISMGSLDSNEGFAIVENTALPRTRQLKARVAASVRGEPGDPPNEKNDSISFLAELSPNPVLPPNSNPGAVEIVIEPRSGNSFFLSDWPALAGGQPRSPRYALRTSDKVQVVVNAQRGLGGLTATVTAQNNPTPRTVALVETHPGFYVNSATGNEIVLTNRPPGAGGTALYIKDEDLMTVEVVVGGQTLTREVMVDLGEVAMAGLQFHDRNPDNEPRRDFLDHFLNNPARLNYYSAGVRLSFSDTVGSSGQGFANDMGRFIMDFGDSAAVPAVGEGDFLYVNSHGASDGRLQDHIQNVLPAGTTRNTILRPEDDISPVGGWSRDAEHAILDACSTLNSIPTNNLTTGLTNWLTVFRTSNPGSKPLHTLMGFSKRKLVGPRPVFDDFLTEVGFDQPIVASWIRTMNDGSQPWALLLYPSITSETLRRPAQDPAPTDPIQYLEHTGLLSQACELSDGCCGEVDAVTNLLGRFKIGRPVTETSVLSQTVPDRIGARRGSVLARIRAPGVNHTRRENREWLTLALPWRSQSANDFTRAGAAQTANEFLVTALRLSPNEVRIRDTGETTRRTILGDNIGPPEVIEYVTHHEWFAHGIGLFPTEFIVTIGRTGVREISVRGGVVPDETEVTPGGNQRRIRTAMEVLPELLKRAGADFSGPGEFYVSEAKLSWIDARSRQLPDKGRLLLVPAWRFALNPLDATGAIAGATRYIWCHAQDGTRMEVEP